MDFFLNKRRRYSKCCIPNCRSYELDPKTFSRYLFPKDHSRRSVWIDNCGLSHLKNVNPTLLCRGYHICSLHFEDCMFKTDRRLRLKDDAIPTLFDSEHEVNLTRHSKLCSQHFLNDDYYPSLDGNSLLKHSAVPSKFLNSRKSSLSESFILSRPSSISVEPNNLASEILMNTEAKKVRLDAKTLNSLVARTSQKKVFGRLSDGSGLTQDRSKTSDKILMNTEAKKVPSGVQTLNSLPARTLQKQVLGRLSDCSGLTQDRSKTNDKILMNTEAKRVPSGIQTFNSLPVRTSQKQVLRRLPDGSGLTQDRSKTSDKGLFLPDNKQGFSKNFQTIKTWLNKTDELNELRTQLQEEKESRLEAEKNLLRLTKKLVEYGTVENFLILCEKHLSSSILTAVKSYMDSKTRHPNDNSFNKYAPICQQSVLTDNHKRPRPCSDNFDELSPSAKKRVCHDTVSTSISLNIESHKFINNLGAEVEVEKIENDFPDEDSIYLLSPVSSLPPTVSSWSDNDSNYCLSSPKKIMKSDKSNQTVLNRILLDQSEEKLKKKLTKEKNKYLELQKRFKSFRKMYDDLEKNSSSLSFFHSKCKIFLSKDFSNFVIMQSKLMRQKSRGFRFPDEIKDFALVIYSLSPDAYHYIQKYCHLPSYKTLIRLKNKNNDNEESITLSNV